MTLYLHDFIAFALAAVMATSVYYVKSKKFRIGVAVFASVLILFNPFRFEQPSGELLERNVSRFDDIPEKVDVQRPSFEERQAAEHNQLKDQSKEIQDEI